MNRITKAIIPVAGWGTRRLPVTKVIEKAMLPVGNRPLVDYVVQDCVKAGINEIIFVVGEQSTQIRDYYDRNNVPLETYLHEQGKSDMLPLVSPLKDTKLHFVVQPNGGKYGTAVPVALAADHIRKDESVVVLMGDDFIHSPDGSSETARLIEAAKSGSAMLAATVPLEEVGRYGVLELNDKDEFVRIIEKPSPEEAPSTLINISKYVLDHDALRYIKDYVAADKADEYLIIEPLNEYVRGGGSIKVLPISGHYLDGGTVEGWFEANRVILQA